MYTTTISEKAKGYLAILTTTFLYGWFGIFVKIIGDSMPIFFQSFSRNVLIASVLLILLIGTQKGIRIPQKADVLKIFARSTFGFINITTALIAFQKLSIGLAYILFFSGLLLGSFAIGTIYNKEKLTNIKLFSLCLTVLGVVFAYAYRTEIRGEFVYMILAIVSGICVAFWSILAQYISKDISATTLNLYDAILLATFSCIASLFVREIWATPSMSIEWIANIGMAVTFLFAGILVPYGFRRVEAQVGSILMPMEVVFGVLFGFIFFRDAIHIALFVGCALIIIASVLPHVWELRDSRRNRRL